MPDMQDFLRRQEQIIQRTGWAVMHVMPAGLKPSTDVPFAYTVGLTLHGYPELLMAGLDPNVAHALLGEAAGRVYGKAQRFIHGQRISDLIEGYDAIAVDGPPTGRLRPHIAVARYGREHVRLQQIVWPDTHGHFPWEPGYGFEPPAQPLIARL